MDTMGQKLNGRGIDMKILEVAELMYQQLNSFYDGASLPIKMLFMAAIGVILVSIFATISPLSTKWGKNLVLLYIII